MIIELFQGFKFRIDRSSYSLQLTTATYQMSANQITAHRRSPFFFHLSLFFHTRIKSPVSVHLVYIIPRTLERIRVIWNHLSNVSPGSLICVILSKYFIQSDLLCYTVLNEFFWIKCAHCDNCNRRVRTSEICICTGRASSQGHFEQFAVCATCRTEFLRGGKNSSVGCS